MCRCRHWRTLLCSLLRLWRTLDPAGLCGPLLRPAPLHHPGAGQELIPVCEILLFHSWRFVMCVYCAYDARPTPLLRFNFIILGNMDATSHPTCLISHSLYFVTSPQCSDDEGVTRTLIESHNWLSWSVTHKAQSDQQPAILNSFMNLGHFTTIIYRFVARYNTVRWKLSVFHILYSILIQTLKLKM